MGTCVLGCVLLLGLAPAQDGEFVIISAEGLDPASFPATKLTSGNLGVINGGLLKDDHQEVWSDLLPAAGWAIVNAGWQDLAAVKGGATLGPVSLISANVGGAKTAYVIRDFAGHKVGLIGVTAPPPDTTMVEIRDPVDALEAILEEVRPQVGAVIVLAQMSPEQGADLLRKTKGVDVCLVSGKGSGDPQALKIGEAWLVEVPWGGALWGRTTLTFGDSGRISGVSHRFVEAGGPPSEEVAAVKVKHGLPGDPLRDLIDSAGTSTRETAPLEGPPVTGNRACRFTLLGMTERSVYGSEKAAEGETFLILDVELENIMPMTIIRKLDVPTQYRIPNLADHLYVVWNGNRLSELHSNADRLPGHIPVVGFKLDRLGAKIRGNVVFEIPEEGVENLEMRFYDFAHGHMSFALKKGKPVEESTALASAENEVLEAGVYQYDKVREVGDRAAPEGMTFVVIELLALSHYTFEVDATAFDPKANKGDRTQIGTVADWDETDRYLRIVVDGEHGYAPEPETRLPEEPRFLPDVLTGERAIFLVPEEFISLELRCEFPNANPPDGGIIHPKPLIFSLQGERPEPTERNPILEIDDDVFHVSLVAQSLVDEFSGAQAGGGQKFLVLDFVVANSGDKGEFFQAPEQIQYVTEKGTKQNLDPVTSLGPYRPGSLVWIPKGERRAFQVVFGVAESDRHRLSYTGISRADILDLSPAAGEPASEEEPVVKRDPKEDPRKPEEPPEPEKPPEPEEAAKPEEPSKPEQPPEPEETEKPEQPPRPEEKPTAGAAARKWDFGSPLGRVSFIPREEAPAWLSERLSRSVDLAYYAFDTQIEIDPPGELPHVVARQRRSLIDRDTWGYEQRGSTTYTLTLLGGRVVSLDGVGIYLRYAATGMRILIEGEGETGQFRRLASETGIDQEGDGLRVYEFDPQRVGRLRIRIESEGEHRPTEIMAFEAPSADRAESILSGGGANIASYSLGGVVMHFSERPTTVFNLIDSDPTTYSYVTGKGGRSTTVVLAFAGNREAKVRAISLRPAFNKDRSFVEELPVRIRVFASTEDPFEGYRLLGEFAVSEAEEEQIFEVPPGAPARFVKVEMIPRPGATYVSLGEIAVYEGSGQGYVSVLFRGGESDLARMTEEKGLDDLVTMPEFTGEKEPNDDEEEAQAVRIQSWIRAKLESGGDRDLFRFTLEHGEDEQPVIEVHMAPFLRAKARILDPSGKQVLDLEIQRAGGTFARLLPSVPPGDYILEVTPLPVFLLLGYDSSGSMGKTFETSQEAIRQWADQLPSGFQVALATSARDKETRKDLTIICPFTADGEKLKEAVEEMFAIDGSSAWYTIVRDLLEYADENVPEDAVEAVVLIADGNGSGEFRKMWARLRQTRARFYTIGFGDVGRRPDTMTSWDGARGLFNVAWYRSGRYFEPHTVEALVTTYDRIFEDLQVAPEYAFRISLKEREEGTLVTEPPPPGENRPILFILDASGSMLAELDDGTKLDIAKSVMKKVVESLPAKSQVGLRVYGHRYRTLDRDKASKDSELVIRIGTLDKPAFLGVLSGIRARGGTPLAYSLEQAASDIRGVKDPRVILITDGLESFRGKPVKAAASLGAELTVVGFDIEEPMDQENLKRMAEAAGGAYTSASNAGSLVESIQEALSPSVFYVILDGQDREVARGKFGDRHTILEGRYTCVLQLAGTERRIPITIRPGSETHIRPPTE